MLKKHREKQELDTLTWMLSRSARYKIHFRKQPPFRGNSFPLSVYIFRFFEFMLLGNSSTTPLFSYNQKKINNSKTLTLTIDSVSAISLSSQRTLCFNNVILHVNEIKIKNAVVNRNYPCQSSPFIHRDERTVSVWVRQKTIETVDWRPRKLGFQHREKTRGKLIEGAC